MGYKPSGPDMDSRYKGMDDYREHRSANPHEFGTNEFIEYERGWWFEYGKSEGKFIGEESMRRYYNTRMTQVILVALGLVVFFLYECFRMANGKG